VTTMTLVHTVCDAQENFETLKVMLVDGCIKYFHTNKCIRIYSTNSLKLKEKTPHRSLSLGIAHME